jgi:hypothetical protein
MQNNNQAPNIAGFNQVISVMQRDMLEMRSEISALKAQVKDLEAVVDPAAAKMINWVDKNTFVQLLEDLGLMDQARKYSSKKKGDSKRFLDRLMRELDLFNVHVGNEPPTSKTKQVWRVSDRKVMFHRIEAVERFKTMLKYGRETFAPQSD